MLNEELIKKVVKHITENNRWDQSTWGSIQGDGFDSYTDEVRPEVWEGVPMYRYDEEDHALISLGLVMEGACDTKFCFAGHTVLQAGDKILMNAIDGGAATCMDEEGNIHSIETRAAQLLGLDLIQANALFDGDAGGKDLERYKRLVTEVTGVTFDA